ncbi:MAG TPA: hypothetical protein VF264_06890 [Rhodanobacteraceae bacterium]
MQKMLILAGCVGIALAASASAAIRPTSYGVIVTSKLAQQQSVALQIEGRDACFADVSLGKPVNCESVADVPRMLKVVWGPASSWKQPDATARNVPTGWKVAAGPTRQVFLTTSVLHPPRWFQSGDVMVFTINKMRDLSITYQCHRPGHECISYPPVTVYGEPQGVASVTR